MTGSAVESESVDLLEGMEGEGRIVVTRCWGEEMGHQEKANYW